MPALALFALLSTLIAPPLDGAFIQYDEALLNALRPDDWRAVMREMHQLGMRTAIVIYLGQAENEIETPPLFYKAFTSDTDDPTRAILDEADKLEPKMEVYLGLLNPPGETNAQMGHWKPQNLGSFAKANSCFAAEVWGKYGGKPAFKGWYIPLENWVGMYRANFGAGTEYPDDWRAFYTNVTNACKEFKATGKVSLPVAISPCLPVRDSLLPPDQAARFYSDKILKDTGLDIVMLQDSIGAKGDQKPPLSPDEAAAYLTAIQKIFNDEKIDIQLWSNVESYELGFIPCNFDRRFDKQLTVTKNATKRVTFEFVHYMYCPVFIAEWEKAHPGYSKLMKDLHDGYQAKYPK